MLYDYMKKHGMTYKDVAQYIADTFGSPTLSSPDS
jgi:hypothetical protein